MNEILFVDKPSGISSYDVIRILQKMNSHIQGRIKMGHAGTLDPAASGLMIIATGTKTRELSEYLKLPKTYEAEILLGVKTESGDCDGKIIEKKEIPEISYAQCNKIVEGLKGTLTLPVSLYSALKKDGKPLYEYAREGIVIENPMREMEILSASCGGYDSTTHVVNAVFRVESGTYIRSLAEELGMRLGTVATLKNLRRTLIGEWDVVNAQILDEGLVQEFRKKHHARKTLDTSINKV